MSIRGKTAIVGIGETPADRLGSKPGEPRQTAAQYLAAAAHLALADAGLRIKDLDGQGLAAVMVSTYPQPFWPGEAAELLGIRLITTWDDLSSAAIYRKYPAYAKQAT